MYCLKNNQVLTRTTGKQVKVLAVIKDESNISRENLVVIADTRTDSLGRVYKISKTNRIVKQKTLERHYG